MSRGTAEQISQLNKERSEAVQMVHYLLARLRSPYRGVSSDALIQSCFSLEPPTAAPHDLDDLARCFYAFHEAPSVLREKMLPTLAEWTLELATRNGGGAAS